MFDRKVHHFDAKGNMVKSTPFTEHIIHGLPNLIVQNGRLLDIQGKDYPIEILPLHLKERYCPHILVKAPQKLLDENKEEASNEIKRPGRPKKNQVEGV